MGFQVFKFGGASVKNASGVRNFCKVISSIGQTPLVVVISAMGKMTNAFEEVVQHYFDKDGSWKESLEATRHFHLDIIKELDFRDNTDLLEQLDIRYTEISQFFDQNQSQDYDYVYDQVVSQAELISTRICSYALQQSGIDNSWVDVRHCIRTNDDHRRARVDWQQTQKQISDIIPEDRIAITQGFVGRDADGNTTTLGREGSDYTAAILAYCLDAEQVSIFKDVPGVLNADPRKFDNTTQLEQISFKEAIEMAFYGASVIHPKTIQPLQRKGIPLRVRSFLDPDLPGTMISDGLQIVPKVPCTIVKENQYLLSISDKEFHFVMEDEIGDIFSTLGRHKMKVNLIQQSAISFTVCVEDIFNNFESLLSDLEPKYKVLYNKDLLLYTIRHYTEAHASELERDRKVLVKQMSRETLQLVVK